MRTSALNFVFGTRLVFPRVGQPLPPFLYPLFTHHSLTGLFSSWNQKKKNPGRTHLPLFFLLGNKNKLNGKTEVFFIIFFFSNSRHNVYQYSNLSVSAPRFSVRTSRHISYWTVCSYATPYSLHLSSLYFNTVKRRVCFG